MDHPVADLCWLACTLAFCGSFVVFERLLQMQRRSPRADGEHQGRAVGIFCLAGEMWGPYPRWEDIRALLSGLRLYVVWLFRMPLWVHADAAGRRALWTMRSLFWLNFIGLEIVKETLL